MTFAVKSLALAGGLLWAFILQGAVAMIIFTPGATRNLLVVLPMLLLPVSGLVSSTIAIVRPTKPSLALISVQTTALVAGMIATLWFLGIYLPWMLNESGG